MKAPVVSEQRLRELLDYNPNTGEFRRKVNRGNARVGSVAGYVTESGYRRIELDGHAYYAQCLAFLWMTGAFPTHDADHINGRRDDNRWENLRSATRQENCQNRRLSITNDSGFKGVRKQKSARRWQARINIGGRSIFLGQFDTPEEAHAAYASAAERQFGEFARTA